MKLLAIKSAVLATLGVMTTSAFATGFVTLPATGFAVGGNTSPYIICNPSGNFGSVESEPPYITDNKCAVFPDSSGISPDTAAASTLILATSGRSIVMNNTYTNGTNVTVATIDERIWRNSDSTACIYGSRLHMHNIDYWREPGHSGSQALSLNGFARSGLGTFTQPNSVQIAYWWYGSTDSALFRAGRTYTSVQHRASLDEEWSAAAGYVTQPLTLSSTASVAITGVSTFTSPLATPTAAQQSAALAANWVEYTIDINYLDDDIYTNEDSPMLYVKVMGVDACPLITQGAPVLTDNAYSFRQTGQEEAPLIEFKAPGYIPKAGNVSF